MNQKKHKRAPRNIRRKLNRQYIRAQREKGGIQGYRSSNAPPFIIPETNEEIMNSFPITKTRDEETGQPYLQYQGLRYINFQPNQIVRISNQLREPYHKAQESKMTRGETIKLYGETEKVTITPEGLVQRLERKDKKKKHTNIIYTERKAGDGW